MKIVSAVAFVSARLPILSIRVEVLWYKPWMDMYSHLDIILSHGINHIAPIRGSAKTCVHGEPIHRSFMNHER